MSSNRLLLDFEDTPRPLVETPVEDPVPDNPSPGSDPGTRNTNLTTPNDSQSVARTSPLRNPAFLPFSESMFGLDIGPPPSLPSPIGAPTKREAV